jgi:phosphoserine phosphatase
MTSSTTPTDQTEVSQPEGVVFLDFDDALIFGSTWRILHQHFGVVEDANEHYDKFSDGEVSFSQWGHLDAGLWGGNPASALTDAAENIDRISGIDTTIQALRSEGYVVGIVSGGVQQLISEIMDGHKLDFLTANNLNLENGRITGDVDMTVTPYTKQDIFEQIASNHSIPLEQTIAIGNSSDDFQRNLRGLQIGLNPSDETTRDMADQIVEGESIEPVIPIIQEWAGGT